MQLGPGLDLDLGPAEKKKREGEGKVAVEIRERIKRPGMNTLREGNLVQAPGSGLLSLFIILSKKRSSIRTRSWDPRKRGEIAGVA